MLHTMHSFVLITHERFAANIFIFEVTAGNFISTKEKSNKLRNTPFRSTHG